MPPTWLLIAAALIGLILILRGMRGRILNDHPCCASCDFDLVGIPNETKLCPECGARTDQPNAVYIGHRERRRQPIAYGTLLLLAVAAIFIAQSTGAISLAQVNRFKPFFLLRRESLHASWPAARAATDELLSRALRGSLSVNSIDTLANTLMIGVETGRLPPDEYAEPLAQLISGQHLSAPEQTRFMNWALALQADQSKPWSRFLGDVIEGQLRASGSTELMKKYLEQSCHPTLHVGPPSQLGPKQNAAVFLRLNWRAGTKPISNVLHLDPAISPSSPRGVQRDLLGDGPPVGTLTTPNDPGEVSLSSVLELSSGVAPSVPPSGASNTGTTVLIPIKTVFKVVTPASLSPLQAQIASMFRCGGGPQYQYKTESPSTFADLTLWAAAVDVPIQVHFDLVWRYGGSDNPLGSFDLVEGLEDGHIASLSGTSVGGSSHVGGGPTDQLNVSVPVKDRGPRSGTFIIRVKYARHGADGGPSEISPFEFEIPDVPVSP